MYRVHTGLCRFIAVPYYSMVHTGSYSVHTGMNSVHTTGHDSRCFLINFIIIAVNLFRSNYFGLLFEAMVLHPMGVGVSISSPLELGLDSQLEV